MVASIRAVLVNPLPYDDRQTPVLDLHRQPAVPFPLLGRRLPGARGATIRRSAPSRRIRREQVTITDGDAAERVTAKDGHRIVLSAARPERRTRPSLRCVRRCTRRSDRRADLAYWARRFGGDPSVLGRTMTDRRRQLHRRRRAAKHGRSARTRRRVLLGGALADADAEGSVLHDGARAPAPRRVAGGGGRRRCGRRTRGSFPIWRRVVPGREGDVGPAGSQDARGRRGRHRRWSSCWRRSAACCLSRAPTPSTC